jgi:hypothetical protein
MSAPLSSSRETAAACPSSEAANRAVPPSSYSHSTNDGSAVTLETSTPDHTSHHDFPPLAPLLHQPPHPHPCRAPQPARRPQPPIQPPTPTPVLLVKLFLKALPSALCPTFLLTRACWTTAPLAMRNLTTSTWPFMDAMYRGVAPLAWVPPRYGTHTSGVKHRMSRE